MTSNQSNNQSIIINFENSSRDNFLSWKRSIYSVLSRHPNNLLTIVQKGELAQTVKVRIKKDAKALEENANAAYLAEFIKEYNTSAYHIIIATVSNKTVLQEMERLFAEKTEGKKAYDHICGLWAIGSDDADERLTAKDDERKNLINKGPQSGSPEHVTKFVEDLLSINNELHGTDWHWKDSILIAIRSDLLESLLISSFGITSSPALAFAVRIRRRMRCVTPAADAHTCTA